MRLFSTSSSCLLTALSLVVVAVPSSRTGVHGLAGQDLPTTTAATGSSCLSDRRALLTGMFTATTTAAVTLGWVTRQSLIANAVEPTTASSMALAAEAGELHGVYFGVGCFWHTQFFMVQAERDRLGRKDSQLTSKTGYAGGTKTGEGGKVCYHNRFREADYGALGHSEVVGVEIPTEEIVPFTEHYFTLFNPKTKDRVDPQDRGGEYRSVVGIPGGIKNSVYPEMEAVAKKAGFSLAPGKGNDPDTLGQQVVYVYDTNKFPFYQAEVYHQYHDDFQSPKYGQKYNDIANQAFEDGRLKITGCPDRV